MERELRHSVATIGVAPLIEPERPVESSLRSSLGLVDAALPKVYVQPSAGYLFVKRALDVVVAMAALLLLVPIFALVAIAIKLTSRGPVFYCSERVGKHGRPFKFLKFRTMYLGSDRLLVKLQDQNEHSSGPIFKMKDDPRITPVGRFLRKYSIDELPQFWHVLTGDMTLVGPRPHLQSEVEHYDERAKLRLMVQPGLTCYWQVMGRSDLSYDEWIDLDLKYIQNMGLGTDLMLLAQTPAALLKARGAY
jgi:lipopolysaccharide/colanic/teichoic acid biosynthesis glycosyltransferase